MQTVSTKDTVRKKENDEMGESVGIQNTTTTTTERVEALIQIENVDESVTTKGVEAAVQREDEMGIEKTTTSTNVVDEEMNSMTNQRVKTNESTTPNAVLRKKKVVNPQIGQNVPMSKRERRKLHRHRIRGSNTPQ